MRDEPPLIGSLPRARPVSNSRNSTRSSEPHELESSPSVCALGAGTQRAADRQAKGGGHQESTARGESAHPCRFTAAIR